MKNKVKNLAYAVLVFGIVGSGIAWGAAGEEPTLQSIQDKIQTLITNVDASNRAIGNMNELLKKATETQKPTLVKTFKTGISGHITMLQDNLQQINKLTLPENQQIEVWISFADTPDNPPYLISINQNAPLSELKQQILNKNLIPIDWQTLTFGDTTLKDKNKTLNDYGIKNQSKIVVTLPPFQKATVQ
jgi:hypothetical protein